MAELLAMNVAVRKNENVSRCQTRLSIERKTISKAKKIFKLKIQNIVH